MKNPGSEHYKYLVISAPTKDISDAYLTGNDAEKNAIQTCQSLVNIAENALKAGKAIEKVVIIEHHPRFDDKKKASLAQLANSTLHHLRGLSSVKDKICIGSHTLHSYGIGKTFENRYHKGLQWRTCNNL